MGHLRYWAATTAVAIAGGFIAIAAFAFSPRHAVWITFGAAIVAAVCSATALGVALVRERQGFSGLSAMTALIASWTVIATRAFTGSTALWIAFGGGVALLVCALRALALHETTVERVVHSLEVEAAPAAPSAMPASVAAPAPPGVTRGLPISAEMRSWMSWLTYIGVAVAGTFVMLMTYALSRPGADAGALRAIAMGAGILVTVMAGCALAAGVLSRETIGAGEGTGISRQTERMLTAVACIVGIAMIVAMALMHGQDARWVAFGIAAGMVGVSLAASTLHELSSEHERHEIEIALATTATAETPAMGAGS